jgi:hypothetical protein
MPAPCLTSGIRLGLDVLLGPQYNTRKSLCKELIDKKGWGMITAQPAAAEMSGVKRYTRVVSADGGASAFEDAELHLNEQHVADGVPAMFVGALAPAQGVAFLRFAAFDSEPHPASEPQWVVMLRGLIEVRVSDGTARQFGPGDLVFASDTSGRGHITLTVGDPPFEALIIPSVSAA